MQIRAFNPSDVGELREIHERFFKEEFEFPDFLRGYHCVFTITDDDNSIICVGGARPICEVLAVTNKDRNQRERVIALKKLFQGCEYAAKREGYDQFHVFVQDFNWADQLTRKDFRPTKGIALVHDV